MKRILFALILAASPIHAAMDVRETGAGCVAGAVSVSTTTPTLIPATAFSGRNRIDLLNYDGAFDVAIGTHSALTFATGFVITSTTTSSVASRATIYLPSGQNVYGLGAANTVRSTVNVRYLECK